MAMTIQPNDPIGIGNEIVLIIETVIMLNWSLKLLVNDCVWLKKAKLVRERKPERTIIRDYIINIVIERMAMTKAKKYDRLKWPIIEQWN